VLGRRRDELAPWLCIRSSRCQVRPTANSNGCPRIMLATAMAAPVSCLQQQWLPPYHACNSNGCPRIMLATAMAAPVSCFSCSERLSACKRRSGHAATCMVSRGMNAIRQTRIHVASKSYKLFCILCMHTCHEYSLLYYHRTPPLPCMAPRKPAVYGAP
jgi:hypothetical protein